jgi:hypothetical protein
LEENSKDLEAYLLPLMASALQKKWRRSKRRERLSERGQMLSFLTKIKGYLLKGKATKMQDEIKSPSMKSWDDG